MCKRRGVEKDAVKDINLLHLIKGVDGKRVFFFFSSKRRHTGYWRDWSSDVCSSDLNSLRSAGTRAPRRPGGRQLGPVAPARLGQDVGDVPLDGLAGQEHRGGDLRVARARRHA